MNKNRKAIDIVLMPLAPVLIYVYREKLAILNRLKFLPISNRAIWIKSKVGSIKLFYCVLVYLQCVKGDFLVPNCYRKHIP